MNDDKSREYDKDFMKMKFNLDDNIHLNKELSFLTITVIIRNTFEKDGKYYPQVNYPPYPLDECLYEV